jgi:hypothetical protein
MALTDAACRAAKPGPVRVKLHDGDGLQLWIQKSGSKLWNLAYRFDGKQRQLALGPYPEVGLGEARSKRERARKMLRDGLDPAANWSLAPTEKAAIDAPTFKEIALEYVEKRRKEGLAAPTMIKKKWLLDFAYPDLGDMAIATIKPKDVLAVLQTVEERGCFETARRLRATIGAFATPSPLQEQKSIQHRCFGGRLSRRSRRLARQLRIRKNSEDYCVRSTNSMVNQRPSRR